MPRGPTSLSVEDSLRYHATMHGMTPMPRAGTLLQQLDRVGLGALRRAIVSRLTPSALRRLAIAEALSAGARILLLDETCSGLAPPAMTLFGELLRMLAADGATIVVASRERTVLATLDMRRYTLFGGSLWGGDRTTAVWTSLKTGESISPRKLS
jgi:ABC-type multidrug transport system ATPase subunit